KAEARYKREKKYVIESLPARGPSWDRASDPLIMNKVTWLISKANVSHMFPILNKKAWLCTSWV
ncbi:MAG: hypothetical protein NTY95_10285, partial [Bacteroidia bacterium]|nr:hypothetical protein [Bacteroidia bacterium]